MTYLCVPIFDDSLEQAFRDAALAAEYGADMVEYRIDTFTDPDEVRALVERSSLPCVVTCRSAEEGGRCELPDDRRLAVLGEAGPFEAQYVDVELATLHRYPERADGLGRKLIVS